VSWYGAQAYCEHYGYSLPTEAQWEYAAAGPADRSWPWGDDWGEWPNTKCCNDSNRGPYGTTFEVDQLDEGMSWCGCLNMAGNVAEWCLDWWDKNYYATSPAIDPQGPDEYVTIMQKVQRGGAYGGPSLMLRTELRSHYYMESNMQHGGSGFRVVKNL